MKSQSVDSFSLFNIFGRKNKISKLDFSRNLLQTEEGCVKLRKMDKVEVRAVIKYFCKKGMSQKVVNDDFIKTLGDESPSYSMVKKLAGEFSRQREHDYEWIMDDYEQSGRPSA